MHEFTFAVTPTPVPATLAPLSVVVRDCTTVPVDAKLNIIINKAKLTQAKFVAGQVAAQGWRLERSLALIEATERTSREINRAVFGPWLSPSTMLQGQANQGRCASIDLTRFS